MSRSRSNDINLHRRPYVCCTKFVLSMDMTQCLVLCTHIKKSHSPIIKCGDVYVKWILNFKPNILNYKTVKSLVTKLIKRNKNGNNFLITRPKIPFYSTVPFRPKCKSKSFFLSMINAAKT